jgi:hypothetical protein
MYNNKQALISIDEASKSLARVDGQMGLVDKIIDEESFLIPYRKGDKWGFSNRKKEIVILCIYDKVESFHSGFAKVMTNDDWQGVWGLIDTFGNYIINLEYRNIYQFSKNLFTVEKNSKHGLINNKGEMVVPCFFDGFRHLHNDYLISIYGGRDGLINHEGKEILKCEYEYSDMMGYFYEGLSSVKKDSKYGFIDEQGEVIIDFQFDNVAYFENNFVRVKLKDKWSLIDKKGNTYFSRMDSIWEKNGFFCGKINNKCGILDTKKQKLLSFIYEEIEACSNGLYIVKNKQHWGIIDCLCKEIVPIIYNSITSCSDNLFMVKSGNLWGIIDSDGQFVLQCEYEMEENQSITIEDGLLKIKRNNKLGYVNLKGEVIIPCEYDSIKYLNKYELFKDGGIYFLKRSEEVPHSPMLFKVIIDGFEGIIDVENNLLTPYLFSEILETTEGLFIGENLFGKNSKKALIGINGKILTNCEYDYIGDFHKGYACIIQNNLRGIIDNEGKEVIACKYQYLSNFDNGLAECEKGFIDINGIIYWEDK